MRRQSRALLVALGALAIFAAVFIVAGLDGWGPRAANEQAVGEVSRWCERVSGGFLREPVNTLGNLGFVVAGLAMFATLARDETRSRRRSNHLIGNSPVALLYAAAVVFLGPGSMVMHGTHTFFGAWIDNVSMVAYIIIPVLLNLSLLAGWSRRAFFATYGAVLAGYAAGYWFIAPDLGIGFELFRVSIPLWIISEVVYRWWSPAARAWSGFVGFGVAAAFGIFPWDMASQPGEYWWVFLFWLPGLLARGPAAGRRTYTPWFWVGIGSFLLAYAVWQTGTADHEWCAPDSPIQAHAIWHVLSAVATWAFFKFLRTDEPVGEAPAYGMPASDRGARRR